MAQIETISKAEAVKQQSRQLRGHIGRDLAQTATPFDKEGYSLLKFHGVYQGYDRDSATERKQRGDDKVWQFMVRVRIPGGRLTADQYLGLDAIASHWADGSLRITTRQSIQFHGVVKSGLKPAIAEVNVALLTTLAACGDVVRTVTTVPAPMRDPVHDRLEADARRLSSHLLPQTGAYHEIWVDGEKWRRDADIDAAEPPDPLYGERYLPRKFKIGLAIPEDNTIDVLTNDLAIVPLWQGDHLSGYDFLLGGGHGMTHNMPKTYPRLASPVAFIDPEDLLDAAAAVVRLHRDYGDRGNRRHARLKYVIAEKGEDWARERLEEYLGKRLEPCRPLPSFAVPDHLGWHEQGDGRLYLGIPVASGRIVDNESSQLRTVLREIVSRFGVDPILMPSQDIILSEIRPEDRDAITAMLRERGVRLGEDMLPAERWALACPALPTCGLALTEAERVRDDIVGAIQDRLARYGLEGERLSIRITGCPNGCARPYTGDIGVVGRMPGYYALFVGGDFEGTRLNTLIIDKVALRGIGDALDPLFALFAADRSVGEGFGDFCQRVGSPALQQALAQANRIRRMLPISVDLARIRAILVGDGAAARRRLALLDEAGAEALEIYAPLPEPALVAMAGARLHRRLPQSAEIARAQLVFVSGVAEKIATEIRRIANAAGILVNVEDDRERSDFHSAAVFRRGDLTVAVSTNGKSPGLAALMRAMLEQRFGPEWEVRLDELAALRQGWREAGADRAAIGRWTREWVGRNGWLDAASRDPSQTETRPIP